MYDGEDDETLPWPTHSPTSNEPGRATPNPEEPSEYSLLQFWPRQASDLSLISRAAASIPQSPIPPTPPPTPRAEPQPSRQGVPVEFWPTEPSTLRVWPDTAAEPLPPDNTSSTLHHGTSSTVSGVPSRPDTPEPMEPDSTPSSPTPSELFGSSPESRRRSLFLNDMDEPEVTTARRRRMAELQHASLSDPFYVTQRDPSSPDSPFEIGRRQAR